MYPEIKLLHTVDTVHCIHRIKLILSTQKLRIIQSLERYYMIVQAKNVKRVAIPREK